MSPPSERKRMLRFPSPLRYPGGKGKVANFMKLLFLENELVGHEYVEPFAGGASVALALLFEDYASHIHINDIDRSVHAFWKGVLEHTDELCERIESTKLTLAERERQRAVQSDDDASVIDLAFSTFVLNRTSRSGILAGGVIGGHSQSGTWRLDARYNTHDLVRRIRKIARFRTRITVSGMDAAGFLEAWTTKSQPAALIYLDPPYYVKGSDLYTNYYRHDDHARLAALVGRLDHPWVVSYDSAPEIRSMYRRFKALSYSLNYSAHERYHGDETMFFAAGLKLPREQTKPAGISVDVVRRAQQLRFASLSRG